MISRKNWISILINLVTFLCTFLTSLIIVRHIGSSKFYSNFIVFTSYGATFLFLSGALKETILYCNKENPQFLYAVNKKILSQKRRIVYALVILFILVLFFLNLLIRDSFISLLICLHIFSFYISETIQFTSVITDQVRDVINFRLFTSVFVLIITWIALELGFNTILYFNILFNVLIPLFLYLRINQGKEPKTLENPMIRFDYKIFIFIAFQYLIAASFIFLERFLLSKSTIDLNSYSISLGLTQNLSAIFLSYLTIEFYSKFVKVEFKELIIIKNCFLAFLILLPFCMIGTTQNEPFVKQIFESKENTISFVSDLSLSLGITIWAIPAMGIQTLLGRYLMSMNKINVWIIASSVSSMIGIILILAAFLSDNHSYLRYCWMITQNISLFIMLVLGLKNSTFFFKFNAFFYAFILLFFIGLVTPYLFLKNNLFFNSVEIILYLIFSLPVLMIYYKKSKYY